MDLSIVIPAHNESATLQLILPELKQLYESAEILVVNDASDDDTVDVCKKFGVLVINHAYQKGNGASVKTGARHAKGDVIVFMDADGQHHPTDIEALLAKMKEGYDMVVGARDIKSHAGIPRMVGNIIYNRLASWMTGHEILDLTSGFRAVNAVKFREFLHILPNGFSYPTTITMTFFRSGYSVAYIPIRTGSRKGKSHIRLFKDGLRFFLIIFRVTALYSPLKLFFPLSALFFVTGAGYYLYTYFSEERFTNMSALLLTTSILIFLIGLLAEQITFLIYLNSHKK